MEDHPMNKPAPRPCVLCGAPIPPDRSEKYLCSTACDEKAKAANGGAPVPTMRTGWAAEAMREKAWGPR
jgi:hypothetical protein